MEATIYTTLYDHGVRKTSTQKRRFEEDRMNQELRIINVYPQVTFQEFEGFGGAITESVGVTLEKMPEGMVQEILGTYFGADGIGYRFIRTHLDSCDFSLSNYSALNDESDMDMEGFSLARDKEHILPYIQAAGEAVPVMLTPWSPPPFMKTNGSKNGGGKLKREHYSTWAAYICRYIKEYQENGINVTKISIQNEPNAVQTWDSCIFTAEEEKTFLRDFLWPTLQKEGLAHIGVYIWDHNKERLFDRALAIIDEDTDHMIEGVAFHWYSGDHFDALSLVRKVLPDKKLLFSEGCIEYSRYDADNQLANAQKYAHDIIGNLNHGMNVFIDWNIVLDQDGGPNHVANYCEAPIICDTLNGTYEKRLSFYYLEHFSRYIKPGAKRIGTTQFTAKLGATAYLNPDNSITLVALNQEATSTEAYIRLDEKLLPIVLPENSISTIVIGIRLQAETGETVA